MTDNRERSEGKNSTESNQTEYIERSDVDVSLTVK